MKLLEAHVKRIKQSFELGNHAVAWGFINSCIDEWDHDDWEFLIHSVPLDEHLIVKYVRHYRWFLYKIDCYSGAIDHRDSLNGDLHLVFTTISKIISTRKKWAQQQYAIKCLTLAC